MTALYKMTKAQLTAHIRELETEPARLRSELAGKKVEIDRLAGELFQKRADDNATAVGAQRIRIAELEEEMEYSNGAFLKQADVITSQRAEIQGLRAQIAQLTRPPLWTRVRQWLATVIAPLLLLTACAFEPENAIPMAPPESYRAVWDSAQACSGVRKRFESVQFFYVPGDGDGFAKGDDRVAGTRSGNSIYLGEFYRDHPMVVKHEMLHVLTGSSHPAVPFETPCKATWETWDRSEPKLAL